MRWRITIRVEHGKPWSYVEDRHETRLKEAVDATFAHFRELHPDVPTETYWLDVCRAIRDGEEGTELTMHPVRHADQ